MPFSWCLVSMAEPWQARLTCQGLSLATRANSHMPLRSARRRVDEPHVLLAEMTASPPVGCSHQFVVVVAAAIAHLRHPRQLHRVVEHRPHLRGIAVDVAFDVRDVLHAPRAHPEVRRATIEEPHPDTHDSL